MPANSSLTQPDALEGRTMTIPLLYRKHPKARRYILRINAQGVARVTIPRGGNVEVAKTFARGHVNWLESQLLKRQTASESRVDDSRVLFRGQVVPIVAASGTQISFGDQNVQVEAGAANLRSEIKRTLWRLAKVELPVRVRELAAGHGFGLAVKRVSVRDQRSRWGSCSSMGVVSLNWRLVQMPDFVRDYIIVHELMHLRQMNHSARFWRLVNEAFP